MPPEPIRQLRDLTRNRTSVTRERTREIQRLENLLKETGIKLSSVAADLNGKSSRAMAGGVARRRNRHRLDGRHGPNAAAQEDPIADRSPLRPVQCPSRVPDPHASGLTRIYLDLIDQHTAAIEAPTERIEVVMDPFAASAI